MSEQQAASDKRLFFALWPGDALRGELAEAAARLPRGSGRLVPADNYHVTLHFLGPTPASLLPALREAAGLVRVESFALLFDRYGLWRRSGMLWLAPRETPTPLRVLVTLLNRIAGELGLPRETRAYRPHITLMRKAHGRITFPPLGPIPWEAREFCLVESETFKEGPRYTVIGRWPLLKGPALY